MFCNSNFYLLFALSCFSKGRGRQISRQHPERLVVSIVALLVNSHANDWTLLGGDWTCTRHEQNQNTLKRKRNSSLVESRLQEHIHEKKIFLIPEFATLTYHGTHLSPVTMCVAKRFCIHRLHSTTIVTNIIVGIFQSRRIFFRKPTDRYLRPFLDISATNNIIYNFKNKLVYFMLYIIP